MGYQSLWRSNRSKSAAYGNIRNDGRQTGVSVGFSSAENAREEPVREVSTLAPALFSSFPNRFAGLWRSVTVAISDLGSLLLWSSEFAGESHE